MNHKRRIFTRNNVLTVIYLMALWFSASTFFQFKTVAVLENDFPGEPSAWFHNGVTENLDVNADAVSVFPNVQRRVLVAKLYDLVPAQGQERFIHVTAKLSSKPSSQQSDSVMSISGDTESGDTRRDEETLFYAWFEDVEKNRVRVAPIAELLESVGQIDADQIIESPANAIDVNVGLLLRKFQAQHSLEALTVTQLERSVIYKAIRGLLILLPLIGLFFALRNIRVHRSVVPISLVMVLVFATTLVAGVLLPGGTLRSLLRVILEWLPFGASISQAYGLHDIQDILHFLGFIGLTLVVLAMCALTKYSRANAVLKLILFAMFTEIIQRHSVERSPSLLDVFIDSAGIFTGVIFWLGLCWVFTRWRKPRELA